MQLLNEDSLKANMSSLKCFCIPVDEAMGNLKLGYVVFIEQKIIVIYWSEIKKRLLKLSIQDLLKSIP